MIGRFAALAFALLLGAAAPAPVQDWTRVAAVTPQGGMRVGNPRAPRRVTEFANYTCSHCADFSKEGSTALTRAIRAGRLSLEVRPIVTHQIGLAATLVARCVPERFLAVNDALYERQKQWIDQSAGYLETNGERIQSYPEIDQLRLVAERGGIVAVATAAGAPGPRIAACLADPARLEATLKATQAAAQIARATPTFVVGGKTYEGLDWAAFARQFGLASPK